MNEFARRQIRGAAEQIIRRAGVWGIVPTPLDAVSRAAGVAETLDLTDLPKDLVARRPNVFKRILGAVFYGPRVVAVDRSQGLARGRFIEAHELSHKILPWHEALFRLDDEERIFGATKKRVDLEADAGAAELLFQGDLFVRRALDYKVSIAAPIGLAPDFGVSLTAGIRHYAVYHPDPVAVIVAGRLVRGNGTVPVWATHESPSFRNRYGSADALFPSGLPANPLHPNPVGEIVGQSLKYQDVASGSVAISDLAGASVPLTIDAFCNGRTILAMLIDERAAAARGRRMTIKTG